MPNSPEKALSGDVACTARGVNAGRPARVAAFRLAPPVARAGIEEWFAWSSQAMTGFYASCRLALVDAARAKAKGPFRAADRRAVRETKACHRTA